MAVGKTVEQLPLEARAREFTVFRRDPFADSLLERLQICLAHGGGKLVVDSRGHRFHDILDGDREYRVLSGQAIVRILIGR